MARAPAPAMLDATPLLDRIDIEGAGKPCMLSYQMLMQCLAARGEIVAGFAWLARGESSGVLSSSDERSYAMLNMLLSACRSVDDSAGASRVQAALHRHSSSAFEPRASTLPVRCED
eukprot:gnl/TRDRNA2_/TRDRNA2_210014_c0_seq1.p1 gnl/TRDRNA2_/TRDRNA2_210014_c0~~gnl/TRDRNA2_/TRDRNA2_210014_c0_seq1.p1  ORF type:complete len:117 (+),score=16.55 gnl/TRDRNA2_/TRDRNA2_210014_c0_seq1:472-822(+)